jgi:RNA polymerase sigma-70 factor (ECF subfamily)
VHDLNQPERLASERDLVARARAGDHYAFGELYRRFAPLLFARVLVPKLGDRAAAEDALAETFRTAFERLDAFEERGVSIYFWFARIATNKALDLHRARGVTGRALANIEGLLAPLSDGPPGPDELYETRVDGVRLRDAVGRVLERLNDRYRRAIELRFVEERSREECADALGVKIGTFDVLVLRALRAFRKEWTDIVGEESGHESGR